VTRISKWERGVRVGVTALLTVGWSLVAPLGAQATAQPAVETRESADPHMVPLGQAVVRLLFAEWWEATQYVDSGLREAALNHARQVEVLRVQAVAQEAERVRVAALAAAEEARRPRVVKPAEGVFTSGFGARWGTTHYGVDIANSIGTPILSAMDGVVIEAGPASGFGLWVRVRHDDGTVTVYGHVDRILAAAGQRVKAGDQIATMGNRGQSTGPHLHFEVWAGGSRKIDPMSWLNARGVAL
jgi:murein DD-endopeptidase MepM/ murein hydrolase activator NlpD